MRLKIIFFLDVIYYYTQLFYKTILKEVSPSIQPSLILGGIIGVPLGFVVDTTYIYVFCQVPNPWLFISSCLGSMVLMYYIYEFKDRKKKVIEAKPRFFKSEKISLFVTILIDLIAILFLFLNGILGKYLLESCY